MNAKFINTGSGQNLLPTIREADQADNLFIGGENELMHWSVPQRKMTKGYGCIMSGHIYSMVQTSDKRYLFVSDLNGC
jgi:WD40 repeat protein